MSFLLTFEDSRHRPPIPLCQMGWQDSCASPVNRAPLRGRWEALASLSMSPGLIPALGAQIFVCVSCPPRRMPLSAFPTAVLSVSANLTFHGQRVHLPVLLHQGDNAPSLNVLQLRLFERSLSALYGKSSKPHLSKYSLLDSHNPNNPVSSLHGEINTGKADGHQQRDTRF